MNRSLVDGWMGTTGFFWEISGQEVDTNCVLRCHFLSWPSSVRGRQQWLDNMYSRALFSLDILQVHYFLSSRYPWLAAQTKNGLHEGSLYLLSYQGFSFIFIFWFRINVCSQLLRKLFSPFIFLSIKINEIWYVKRLAQCLAHNNGLIHMCMYIVS